MFVARIANVPANRSAVTSGTDLVVSGSPVVYSTPYQVFDGLGTTGFFTETIMPGAFTAALKGCDCKFLYDHKGLVLARTTSGTLTLVDTAQALTCSARLDSRQDVAWALAVALSRGDVSEMSVGMIVDPTGDTWSNDFSRRTITKIREILDVSAVGRPASPTTEISLESELDVEAGPYGDQGGNQGGSVPDSQDGTGSRSRRVEVDLALARLRAPITSRR